MNIENIKKTITIMERAKLRDDIRMETWQSNVGAGGDKVSNEAELHACGNKACLAGYIGLSPEWIEAGGETHSSGEPYFPFLPTNKWDAAPALAHWWGLPSKLTELFVLPYCAEGLGMGGDHLLYGKHWTDIRVDDVLRILNELLDIGEVAFKEKYATPQYDNMYDNPLHFI